MQSARSTQPSRYLYAGALVLSGMLLVWVLSPAAPDAVPQVLLETFSRLEYVEQRVRKLEQELSKCPCGRRGGGGGNSRVARAVVPSMSSNHEAIGADGPVTIQPVDLTGPIVPWDGKSVLESKGLDCDRKDLVSPSKYPFALCLDTKDLKHDLIARTGRLPDCDGALRLVEGQLPSSGIFLDVGSNTGICSMFLLSAGWKVVGFEPSPRNLFFLSKSVLLNPELKTNLTLYPVALGAESAAVPLYTERSNLANSVLGYPTRADPKSPVSVRVATMDEILWPDATLAPPVVAGVKLDVRGFELNVLRGAARLLKVRQRERSKCCRDAGFQARAIKSMAISVATEWLRNAKASPSELCALLRSSGFALFEDGCAGEGVEVRERGAPVDAARCRHWDETNAECGITARVV